MPTFQIIFQGKILEGHSLSTVKQKIAAIFNKDVKQIESLFSGKPVVIKKDIDEATALKYQAVFKKAGAICIVKSSDYTDNSSTNNKVRVDEPVTAAPQTATTQSQTSTQRDVVSKEFSDDFSEFSLAAPGAVLVAPHEEPVMEINDFSTFSLAELGALLSEPKEIEPFEISEDISGLTLEKTDSHPVSTPE